MRLAPHGIKGERLHIGLHLLQELDNLCACNLDSISVRKVSTTYRLRMPSSSAELVPSQVSATRCCTHHDPRRLLDLLVGHCFIACYWIVAGMEAKSRNANGENGIGRRGVTVVCLGFQSDQASVDIQSQWGSPRWRTALLYRIPFVLQDLFFVQVQGSLRLLRLDTIVEKRGSPMPYSGLMLLVILDPAQPRLLTTRASHSPPESPCLELSPVDARMSGSITCRR
ncbi:hypothetical protein KC367_g283 [Hortaea werneckii]|nr:hypothetical protein KC367_g283 [Hortaea werneckii]